MKFWFWTVLQIGNMQWAHGHHLPAPSSYLVRRVLPPFLYCLNQGWLGNPIYSAFLEVSATEST